MMKTDVKDTGSAYEVAVVQTRAAYKTASSILR